ncbi:MAG: nuclear transport factor 2 family protein [Candidatus Limnocylindria bacterium]
MSETEQLTPDQRATIEQTARDYYEGWFNGDAERMARSLHPKLAKRNVDQPDRADSPIDETDWEWMVEGARDGRGTRHRGTPVSVTIFDATANMAAVRVEGGPYIDLLHVGRFGSTWRIVNVLWEPRPDAVPEHTATGNSEP